MYRLELEAYPIYFEQDFHALSEALRELEIKNCKVMVVFDSNTAYYYKESFMSFIKGFCLEPFSFLFEAGEKSKHLGTVSKLYEELIRHRFERNDILIAFGGGVVGDLTGFAAATYLRGIRFLQIPTSLLAMADSSIGGKTGVDFLSYKNMVGAFHQPSLVYINLSLLRTLPDREYLSGMAEIIKAGYIKDGTLVKDLKIASEAIRNRDYETLEPILYRACKIKKEVVEADFKEKGERALLNFGHTLGHAIEKLMNFSLLHGECVAIGMLYAVRLSIQKGYLGNEVKEELKSILRSYSLPYKISTNVEFTNKDVLAATKLDKKMDKGSIQFILLKEVGRAFIDKTITDSDILACMKDEEE